MSAANLLAAAALLAAGLAAGYAWRGERGADVVSDVRSERDVCVAALASKRDVLAQVQASLDEQRERHKTMLDAAHAALDARDEELSTLREAAEARAAAIRKTAHEDPSVGALARMPVPAALARQLWPRAAAPEPAAH